MGLSVYTFSCVKPIPVAAQHFAKSVPLLRYI